MHTDVLANPRPTKSWRTSACDQLVQKTLGYLAYELAFRGASEQSLWKLCTHGLPHVESLFKPFKKQLRILANEGVLKRFGKVTDRNEPFRVDSMFGSIEVSGSETTNQSSHCYRLGYTYVREVHRRLSRPPRRGELDDSLLYDAVCLPGKTAPLVFSSSYAIRAPLIPTTTAPLDGVRTPYVVMARKVVSSIEIPGEMRVHCDYGGNRSSAWDLRDLIDDALQIAFGKALTTTVPEHPNQARQLETPSARAPHMALALLDLDHLSGGASRPGLIPVYKDYAGTLGPDMIFVEGRDTVLGVLTSTKDWDETKKRAYLARLRVFFRHLVDAPFQRNRLAFPDWTQNELVRAIERASRALPPSAIHLDRTPLGAHLFLPSKRVYFPGTRKEHKFGARRTSRFYKTHVPWFVSFALGFLSRVSPSATFDTLFTEFGETSVFKGEAQHLYKTYRKTCMRALKESPLCPSLFSFPKRPGETAAPLTLYVAEPNNRLECVELPGLPGDHFDTKSRSNIFVATTAQRTYANRALDKPHPFALADSFYAGENCVAQGAPLSAFTVLHETERVNVPPSRLLSRLPNVIQERRDAQSLRITVIPLFAATPLLNMAELPVIDLGQPFVASALPEQGPVLFLLPPDDPILGPLVVLADPPLFSMEPRNLAPDFVRSQFVEDPEVPFSQGGGRNDIRALSPLMIPYLSWAFSALRWQFGPALRRAWTPLLIRRKGTTSAPDAVLLGIQGEIMGFVHAGPLPPPPTLLPKLQSVLQKWNESLSIKDNWNPFTEMTRNHFEQGLQQLGYDKYASRLSESDARRFKAGSQLTPSRLRELDPAVASVIREIHRTENRPGLR